MAAVLIVYAIYHDLRHRTGLLHGLAAAPPGASSRGWSPSGLPAAVHVTLEVGVFAAATTLAGMLDPVALAAHHIVLDISSVTFMIPLGLASAGAVRVGQALGRGEPAAAGHAGWTALALGVAFMACAGLVFATLPRRPGLAVHHRPGRDRHRRHADAGRRRLPALRRPPGRLDRHACAGPATPTRRWSATSSPTG